jgi:hypothetical protein
MGMIDGEMTPSAQARAREGVEHLQAAARELIEAARAALDVAEELVDDPESVASLVGTLASAADVAKRVTGSGGWPRARPSPAGAEASPPEGEPRVQRIAVS